MLPHRFNKLRTALQWLLSLCRTIVMSFEAFHSRQKFYNGLLKGFGAGLIVNGSITNGDLSDYLMYLKDEYISSGNMRSFRLASHTGYMGNSCWFLSPEVRCHSYVSLEIFAWVTPGEIYFWIIVGANVCERKNGFEYLNLMLRKRGTGMVLTLPYFLPGFITHIVHTIQLAYRDLAF